jgi:hypothetical protein
VRCQSTTSISAADAISANGTAVQRVFDTSRLTYDRAEPEAAIAAETSSMLTAYRVAAVIVTWATTVRVSSPGTRVKSAPATAPTRPNTPALKTVRMSGRRSMSATSVGAVA